nr:MAG TPA: hypothetical protein [Caudoviricetes sp.]
MISIFSLAAVDSEWNDTEEIKFLFRVMRDGNLHDF